MIWGTDVNIPIPDTSRGWETCYSKCDPQEQNLQLHTPTQLLEMQSPWTHWRPVQWEFALNYNSWWLVSTMELGKCWCKWVSSPVDIKIWDRIIIGVECYPINCKCFTAFHITLPNNPRSNTISTWEPQMKAWELETSWSNSNQDSTQKSICNFLQNIKFLWAPFLKQSMKLY